MEKNTEPSCGGKGIKKRRHRKITPRVKMATEVLRTGHPAGSQFKGNARSDVQDLMVGARAVHDRRGRWPGEMIVAPLPGGIRSHLVPHCVASC